MVVFVSIDDVLRGGSCDYSNSFACFHCQTLLLGALLGFSEETSALAQISSPLKEINLVCNISQDALSEDDISKQPNVISVKQ